VGQPQLPPGSRVIGTRNADLGAILLPILRDVSDELSMAKDSRFWFGHRLPKLLR